MIMQIESSRPKGKHKFSQASILPGKPKGNPLAVPEDGQNRNIEGRKMEWRFIFLSLVFLS
jgi:hypothetical protein